MRNIRFLIMLPDCLNDLITCINMFLNQVTKYTDHEAF
jgi:hypothetical protein